MLIGYARVSTADQNLDLQHGAGQGRLREGADENRKGLAALTRCAAGDDTTRREGKLIFAVFAAFAEFERELIRERIDAGGKAPGPSCRQAAQADAAQARPCKAIDRRGSGNEGRGRYPARR